MTNRISRKDFLRGTAASVSAAALSGTTLGQSPALAAAKGNNPITVENAKTGSIYWEIWEPAYDNEIEGYASLTSVNRGQSISFYVNCKESTFTIEIFRLGWYGGVGGRRMTNPVRLYRYRQKMPSADAYGMVECNWRVSYSLTIPWSSSDPTHWCSGYYVAKLTAGNSGKQRYIPFVVRDDNRAAAYLYQSSVTTDQAYNNWGGKSLYDFNSSGGRAYKVSFNRPNADGRGTGFVVNSWAGWELKTIRFLEREGYDVTYSTNIDTHANPSRLLTRKGFISAGHDEYWSWQMRNAVETAISQRVGVAFLSANTCYAQIRLESSPRTGAANRTMVCYKEDYARDPAYASAATRYLTTTTWRDPVLGRPEDALIGTMFDFYPAAGDIVVENTGHWIYADTGLVDGDRLVGLLGYEADRMFGNAPASTVRLAHSPLESGAGHSDMTIYAHQSGATVFATGSMHFAFGLDSYFAGLDHPDRWSPPAQQMMRNLLARFVA